MVIQICIGSACHLKGSYTIVDELQRLIKEDNREEDITIKASFCLGHCTSGVSVKVDDDDVISVSPEMVSRFYYEDILRRVNE